MPDEKTTVAATEGRAITGRPTDRASDRYAFVRTEGREKGLAIFDEVFRWLDERSHEHATRGNDDLLNTAKNVAQQVMNSVERLCEKWEESDKRGLTY